MVLGKKARESQISRGFINRNKPKAVNPNSPKLSLTDVTNWMMAQLQNENCLYQQDVVDYLVKNDNEQLLKENADGNLVLSTPVINQFRKVSGDKVVWVKPERYWRYRVNEDEPGREARG